MGMLAPEPANVIEPPQKQSRPPPGTSFARLDRSNLQYPFRIPYLSQSHLRRPHPHPYDQKFPSQDPMQKQQNDLPKRYGGFVQPWKWKRRARVEWMKLKKCWMTFRWVPWWHWLVVQRPRRGLALPGGWREFQ